MVQYTSKLGLYKPGGGSSGTNTPDETADIDKLNGNFDDIDAAVGVVICTSSTRPGTPWTGQIVYETDTNSFQVWNGTAWASATFVESVTPTNTVTFTNKTLTSPHETTTVTGTAATGTIAYNTVTQSDLYYTSSATGNFTLNFRGDSGVTLTSLMNVGDTITTVFRNTNGSTAYYLTGVSVDGTSVTPKWQGGTAPSAGNASAVDVYTFAITKTGSSSFAIFASLTKFA